MTQGTPPARRFGVTRKRYGVRTLAFLALAALALLVSGLQGHYTVLTLFMLVAGFLGAAINSVRGLTRL